jgi:hypothetical protein
MIQMNRNHISFFGRNGGGSLGDAPAGDQAGNRELRPDHGNRGIDGNMGGFFSVKYFAICAP